MSTTIQSKLKTGALIAAGAAVLIMGGYAGAADKDADAAKVHCTGVNSCKGTSDCKTAENACKGQNVCKGHGFLAMTAKDCAVKGGTEG